MLHNLCHVPAYAGMAFLLIGVFRVFSVKRVFVKAFFFSLLYGIIMEFFQGLVPGRTPSLLDMGLNTLGALITIFLVRKGLLKGFLSD
jgi:VanZ family protein